MFALVVTTYSPKGFSWFVSVTGENSFEENSKICFLLPVKAAAIFASYHRWMKLKFEYVVLLSVINVLNGGDEELTVQQGDMYVEQ